VALAAEPESESVSYTVAATLALPHRYCTVANALRVCMCVCVRVCAMWPVQRGRASLKSTGTVKLTCLYGGGGATRLRAAGEPHRAGVGTEERRHTLITLILVSTSREMAEWGVFVIIDSNARQTPTPLPLAPVSAGDGEFLFRFDQSGFREIPPKTGARARGRLS
jgi:hypothetical protein